MKQQLNHSRKRATQSLGIVAPNERDKRKPCVEQRLHIDRRQLASLQQPDALQQLRLLRSLRTTLRDYARVLSHELAAHRICQLLATTAPTTTATSATKPTKTAKPAKPTKPAKRRRTTQREE